MRSILTVWRVEDRLKTLAFALPGWGCFMSFKAGGLPPSTSILQVLGLQIGSYVVTAAAVVLALEIGNRARRRATAQRLGE